ncbi:TraB/GumN family protein [Erythrobacter crassostreae]|uniref:TraB/GumN family protein n=1 Tax=Erythrobacter crassostreae TaxID=2828328 RepID=A0A9X1F5N6_9SPHN|nr:TraB/GumN family protein [Erythrobacter crassostrea]MBV7259948.1 TraB/GumN family protein [Erythrobacter crassostrea]
MKLRSILTASAAAAALFAGAPAIAQQTTQPVEDEKVLASEKEMEEATGVPAMWKVADEDTTIFLFGTVHTLPDDVNWKTETVSAAIASSDSLVTEIDMTPESMQAAGQMMAAKGMLTDGQTLRGLMNDEQRATFEAGLGKIGIPAAAFDKLEPWFASIAMLQVVTQASGFDDSKGVETVLESTISEGTERVALETIDFQISVFDELPMDQQVLFLLEGAEDPLAAIETLNQLVGVWASGKVEELGVMMNEGFMTHPNLAERLLYERNANWAEWIDTRLDTPGTVFIAVGAGHLAGERSVQEYLANRDIEATRVQ